MRFLALVLLCGPLLVSGQQGPSTASRPQLHMAVTSSGPFEELENIETSPLTVRLGHVVRAAGAEPSFTRMPHRAAIRSLQGPGVDGLLPAARPADQATSDRFIGPLYDDSLVLVALTAGTPDTNAKRLVVTAGAAAEFWHATNPSHPARTVPEATAAIRELAAGEADQALVPLSAVAPWLQRELAHLVRVVASAPRYLRLAQWVPAERAQALQQQWEASGGALDLRQLHLPLPRPATVDPSLWTFLDDAERGWLTVAPPLRLAVDPGFAPFDYLDNRGRHVGVASDVLAFIRERTGLRGAPVERRPWSESLAALQAGTLDLAACIAPNEERAAYLRFSRPYAEYPAVLIARREDPLIDDLDEIAARGLRLAVPTGYYTSAYLASHYPDIERLLVNSPTEALYAVSRGEADATFSNAATASYLLGTLGGLDLKMVAFFDDIRFPLTIGTRRDLPHLAGIIDKTLAQLDEPTRLAINDRWIRIPYEPAASARGLIRGLLVGLGIVLLLLASLFLRNRYLARAAGGHAIRSQELSQLSREYEIILENSLVGIAYVRHRRVLRANTRFAELFGARLDEVIGRKTADLYRNRETWERIGHVYREQLARGEPHDVTLQLRRFDGTAFWGRLIGKAVNPTEPDEGSIWLLDDVTDRKHAEDDLRDRETRFRTLFEESPIALWEEDWSEVFPALDQLRARGVNDLTAYFAQHPERVRGLFRRIRLIDANQAALRLWRRDRKHELWRDDPEGRDPRHRFLGEAALASGAAELAAAMGQSSFTSEVRLRPEPGTDDARERVLALHAAHLPDARVAFVSALDVTARVQGEERLRQAVAAAEAANHAKSELLGLAAHDLRNPLAGIQSLADLLKEELADGRLDQARNLTDDIRKGADELFNLVSGVLHAEVIASGQLRQQVREIDVVNIIRRVLEINLPAATRKHQQLKARLPDAITAHLDPERLFEIGDNLVSNAVKYAPPETTITVTLTHDDAQLRLVVEDQGPGLSEEDQKRLFQRFRKLSTKPTGGESSTGLGLAITHQLIQLLGGRITCRSRPGEGAAFTVELPLTPVDAPVEA